MAADLAPEPAWSRLSEWIARKTGLHFPPERRADLQRGLTGAAEEFGFTDASACADWLLSARLTRAQLHALAGHLTVGETYFFRDRNTFDALAEHVLPELIRRRGQERRLSLWSAACCTGEEAYSLAILLQQCLPQWRDWRITLLATDINERFLEKARAAVYGDWSFRDTPAGLKALYFTSTADGRYAVQPQIKDKVRFERCNLVEDDFAELASGLGGFDLILCRNVLMYFTPAQADKVVSNLHRVLRADGWLVVAASEGSQTLAPRFTPVSFTGAILYQKTTEQTAAQRAPVEHVTPEFIPQRQSSATVRAVPSQRTPTASVVADQQPRSPAHEARALANRGSLTEALAWCDRWIAADALDGAARYLRAVILQELGERESARRALQQTIYLQSDFVLAHFALGTLARQEGRTEESNKHLGNALTLLRRCASDEILPESDGLTASRLREIIASLLGPTTAS